MLKSTGKIKSTPLKKFRIQKKYKKAKGNCKLPYGQNLWTNTDLQGKLLREATSAI